MPAPLVGVLATAIARAIAAQAAKQGVKKLAQSEARIIARKVIAQKGGPKAVSGKSLDRAINIANQSARSSKPVKNKGGGLRTTYSGPVRGKISKVAATRAAEKAAGPRARREGGSKQLRSVVAKPGATITRKTSGGPVVRMGPGKKINVKLTQRAEGPARPVKVKKTVTQGRIVRDIKSTDFVRPADRTRIVSGEARPFLTKEKVTVSKPVIRKTNKNGSAITVRKTEPRKAAEVRAERAKAKREKLRDALTPRVNPARPKIQPKRGKNERDERTAIETTQPQGITVRGKFYPDGNRGLMPRGQQPTIGSRVSAGAEKPTRGNVNTLGDKEASDLAQRSMRDVERPSLKVGADFKPKKSASRVKPGVRTNTTRLIREIKKSTNPADKKAKTAELKRVIRNQRRVLKEREIKEAAERIRKAEEAAKSRGNGLLKGRVIKK